MAKERVLHFEPYPFEPGDKIHIEGGSRGGDWKVIDITDRKVVLQCPRTQREYEWDRFCYFLEETEETEWPGP